MTDFNCIAELKHINLRKEGPNDSKEPAIDLKLYGLKIPADIIDELMCGNDDGKGRAKAAFWDEDGNQRFWNLHPIAFIREIEHAKVTIESIDLGDCKIKKFEFTPGAEHTGNMTFSVSTSEPPGRAIAVLAEMLQENVTVQIVMPQGDLFDGDGDPKEAAAKLGAMVREDGGTATLESGGKVLATFGDK